MDPSSPVGSVRGVGTRNAQLLGKLGIVTVADLLSHLPRRHEDRRHPVRFDEASPGASTLVRGRIVAVEARKPRPRLTLVKVFLEDDSPVRGVLVFFNQRHLAQRFEALRGREILAFGTVRRTVRDLEMTAPDWELVDEEGEETGGGGLVPVYALTEGLSASRLRTWIREALDATVPLDLPERLPAQLVRFRGLPRFAPALRAVHFPTEPGDVETGRRRLAYEELLVLQLLLQRRRRRAESRQAPVLAARGAVDELAAVLPFAWTGAQRRVVAEIEADLARAVPMHRLVQGDVGSGKTAVAMAAMAIASRAGHQCAMMAPTELLAHQHLVGVRATLEEMGIRVDLLTGSRSARERDAVRERVASGETGVVVGTHALIQEGLAFRRLGLAVIDEQHRFGVAQRAALAAKGGDISPHVLVMTATPIPRTLSMTVYGDLDVSVIDELPAGRRPIRTHWKSREAREKVYAGVRELVGQGRQAYVVCPLVEQSEDGEARAVDELAAELSAGPLAGVSLATVHGRMPEEQRHRVMERFRSGEFQMLVATTVIEVGVDVPNAVAMVVEDADRFGLAQLHQLRGRVGRGAHASFCVLVADPESDEGRARLETIVGTTDGFAVAEEDLRQRGPGEFLGVRQSGLPPLRVARLPLDLDLVEAARDDARRLLDRDPDLADPTVLVLRDAVRRREHDVESEASA